MTRSLGRVIGRRLAGTQLIGNELIGTLLIWILPCGGAGIGRGRDFFETVD